MAGLGADEETGILAQEKPNGSYQKRLPRREHYIYGLRIRTPHSVTRGSLSFWLWGIVAAA